MNRLILFIVTILAGTGVFAQVNNTKLTGQSFKGEVIVDASPKVVWAVITDIQKLSDIENFEYQGTPKKLTKVGDSVPMEVFGDKGTFVLTYAEPNEELRYTWEPENASYLCQERWVLSPSGNGTKIIFEDRYTESGPQTEEDIAAQVKLYNEALTKLKAFTESQGGNSK